jgi:hypothetical protein
MVEYFNRLFFICLIEIIEADFSGRYAYIEIGELQGERH